MIELQHKIISNIPVLELFKKKIENEKLPAIIFYHGWESYKERVLEHGYNLAEQGFRVLLPESLDHGERIENGVKTQDPLNFWGIVTNNIQEFPLLINDYIDNGKIDSDRIGVAGLSMGGITTSAILTQYNSVKAAAVLMGTPAPIEFTKWLLDNYKVDHTPISKLLDIELINSRLDELKPIALNLQPEKIANRPVYFWHGTADEIVPFHLTKKFISENKNHTYGENIEFDVTENVGHKVPREISQKMAQYFKENL